MMSHVLEDGGTTHDLAYENLLERSIENAYASILAHRGHKVQRQVRCSNGIADIVTDTAIYEIKLRLTRESLFQAVGQVLLYRQAIDPTLEAHIVGQDGGVAELVGPLKELGITVTFWEPTKQPFDLIYTLVSDLSSFGEGTLVEALLSPENADGKLTQMLEAAEEKMRRCMARAEQERKTVTL